MHEDFHEHHQERGRGRERTRRGPRGHFDGDDFSRFLRHRGGRRLRRGDVRAAVLVLLEEGPRNGYQLIQELSERSNGNWRPSPGSVYPILQQLNDEGLVVEVASPSGRSFALSEAGQTLVNDDRETLGRPWEGVADSAGDSSVELFSTLRQVAMASRQVAVAGSDAQTVRAVEALAEARRSIYRILAEENV